MAWMYVFNLKNLIKSNPTLFKPLFVHSDSICAESVKMIIQTESPPPTANVTKLRILEAIGIFLDECSGGKQFKFI